MKQLNKLVNEWTLMSGKYLLDTNIIIALFAAETDVTANLASAEEVFLPTISIGELCYGARKPAKPGSKARQEAQLSMVSPEFPSDSMFASRHCVSWVTTCISSFRRLKSPLSRLIRNGDSSQGDRQKSR